MNFEERIRAARYRSGHRHLPLTPHAERELEVLLSETVTGDAQGVESGAPDDHESPRTSRLQTPLAHTPLHDERPEEPPARARHVLVALVACVALAVAVGLPLGLHLWPGSDDSVPPAAPGPTAPEPAPTGTGSDEEDDVSETEDAAERHADSQGFPEQPSFECQVIDPPFMPDGSTPPAGEEVAELVTYEEAEDAASQLPAFDPYWDVYYRWGEMPDMDEVHDEWGETGTPPEDLSYLTLRSGEALIALSPHHDDPAADSVEHVQRLIDESRRITTEQEREDQVISTASGYEALIYVNDFGPTTIWVLTEACGYVFGLPAYGTMTHEQAEEFARQL